MALSVRNIYNQVCDCLLEPGQLTGDVITDDQFIALLNQALIDFLQLGAYIKPFINQTVAGQGDYSSPGPVTVAKNLSVDGSGLPMNSGWYWDQSDAAWQNMNPGNPQEWRQDQLDEPGIEVRPAPSWDGYNVGVSGGLYGTPSSTSALASTFDVQSDPNNVGGLLGTVSEFDNGNVYVDCAGAFYGVISSMVVSPLNITQFSIASPQYTIESLDEYIPNISPEFIPYLRMTLIRMISANNAETKNLNANKYFSARTEEGSRLIKTITEERQIP